MDGSSLYILRKRISAVDRFTQYVEHAAEYHVTYRYLDRVSSSCDFHAAAHSLRTGEHDASYQFVADVLSYVQYNPKRMVRNLEIWARKAVQQGKITLEEGKEFLATYRSGLYGYTYLE